MATILKLDFWYLWTLCSQIQKLLTLKKRGHKCFTVYCASKSTVCSFNENRILHSSFHYTILLKWKSLPYYDEKNCKNNRGFIVSPKKCQVVIFQRKVAWILNINFPLIGKRMTSIIEGKYLGNVLIKTKVIPKL